MAARLAEVKLHESWALPLAAEFDAPYMADLKHFLAEEHAAGKIIYPPAKHWFFALDATPLDDVRVVIIGQDPYHGPGQAHGLSFSVQPGVKPPPSLVNIYKELQTDLGIVPPRHGYLQSWAQQGVLLLNSVLTVEAGQPASHQGKGWERFTDAVLQLVIGRDQPTVFMLWGSHAQRKVQALPQLGRHLILRAPHPSPLAAYKGWFGCRHFSKANAFLIDHGLAPIDWQLPLDA